MEEKIVKLEEEIYILKCQKNHFCKVFTDLDSRLRNVEKALFEQKSLSFQDKKGKIERLQKQSYSESYKNSPKHHTPEVSKL